MQILLTAAVAIFCAISFNVNLTTGADNVLCNAGVPLERRWMYYKCLDNHYKPWMYIRTCIKRTTKSLSKENLGLINEHCKRFPPYDEVKYEEYKKCLNETIQLPDESVYKEASDFCKILVSNCFSE